MDWFLSIIGWVASSIIAWAALMACAFYLHLKRRERLRHWVPRDDPKKWTGHGLDTSKLSPRVEVVRQQYAASQQAPRNCLHHRSLLDIARRTVLQLGYFQHQEPEERAPLNGS